MTFKTSAEGRQLIRGIEKFEHTFYYDQKGVGTVGYGHAIVMNGKQVNWKTLGRPAADALCKKFMMDRWGKTTITEAEGDELFSEDMKEYEAAVNTVCDDKTYQCEFDAMVSFAFNCGSAGFKKSSVAKFHGQGARKVGDISMAGLCAYSKTKNSPTNIKEGFAAWSRTGGEWALGLYRRRLAEILVYSGRSAAEAMKTAWSFKG